MESSRPRIYQSQSHPASRTRTRPQAVTHTRTLPRTIEYTLQTPLLHDGVQSSTHPGKVLDQNPTLNNTLYMTQNIAQVSPSYSWSTTPNKDGHPTTLFTRDGRPIARVVWMGGQFKELARSISSAGRLQRAPRNAAQALDLVTASRCSTLKLGDQPTIGLDDFLMKCGTFTKRRSRKFASNSQLFTWLDENGADLTLIAGENTSSERIAVLDEQTGTLRVGALGMRMLHLDVLVVTAVIMLHRRWQRSHH